MVFQKSITKSIDTTDTKKPNSPQITIKNPLDKETFVNGIELILEPEFSKKGKLVIMINDISVFDENDSSGFAGYSKFPIPLNKSLKRSNDIKIFAWNGEDSNKIEVRMNTSISENAEPFQSQAVPLAKDLFNTVVSESEILFEQRDYSDEEITKLISMGGYKKMNLLISGSGKTPPTLISDTFGFADTAPIVDLDTASPTEYKSASTSQQVIVDFGSIASRIPKSKSERQSSLGGSYTVELFVSDDNISYSLVDSLTSSGNPIDDLEGSQQSFRYAKLVYTLISGNTNLVRIYEVFDGVALGGTASISFEILDIASQNWITVINASQIGAITNGGSVSKQLGDVVNDVSNNKFNVLLPSTQTGFRAKMIVGGNINTGVSIVKVQ